jgi:hypothetical protein
MTPNRMIALEIHSIIANINNAKNLIEMRKSSPLNKEFIIKD